MNENMGYRLLRGRSGASGHIRVLDHGKSVSARGLSPGETYTLYLLKNGKAQPWEKKTADTAGRADFSPAQGGAVFVAAGERVLLWEDGENADQTYLTACASLKKRPETAEIPATEKREIPQEQPEKENEPAPLPEPEETMPVLQEESLLAEEPKRKESYTLRAPGGGTPVDALPELIWPAGTEQARAWFEERPPMAPFSAPGWRFVRVPSHVPGAAYSVLGRYARDGRVTGLLRAVPGGPYRPPAFLPGYRYQPGRDGMGYWISVQEV